jgi:hypothetical protein
MVVILTFYVSSNVLQYSKKDSKNRGVIFYDIAFSPVIEIPQATTAINEGSTSSHPIQLKPIEKIEQGMRYAFLVLLLTTKTFSIWYFAHISPPSSGSKRGSKLL